MLSGGSSSLITDVIYFPLDSIKTRLQVDNFINFAHYLKFSNRLLLIELISSKKLKI